MAWQQFWGAVGSRRVFSGMGALLGVSVLVGWVQAQSPAPDGPLAKYVRQPDASYQWRVRREGRQYGCDFAELILTSQTWRGTAWKHQLVLFRPAGQVDDTKQALLFITGGSWRDEYELPAGNEPLPRDAAMFAGLASQLRSVVAVLLHVPHQPLFGGMHEDQIIAYTFSEYMQTGDDSWPLLLPMVKSAVRGMDATTEFAQQRWNLAIQSFTVTGASKRGWTTWLTGAIDPRATAIAPMVIDVLNMARQMEHQRAVWGKVSDEIHDYSERGLTEEISSERGEALRKVVDPYYYRDALMQPKLLLIGTNDNYWPIDALNLYWDDLRGPKYVMYVPNNGHGLRDMQRVAGALNVLHQHAARGFALPKLEWEYAQNGQGLVLEVSADKPVKEAQVWMATSDDRDFRDETWSATPMVKNGDGRFQFTLNGQAEPHTALFGELVFDCNGMPFYLSTNVRVVSQADTAQGQ